MTDSISLEALGAHDDSVRRDQYGRYLVVPPDGDKPVGYTRVTTVAKTLDSGGGLAPWKAAMTASGIIMRRGLRAQWETLLAEHGDPWYAGTDVKARCRALVEECAAVGGANDRREVGSALHAITALIDDGHIPHHLTDETAAFVQAYEHGLAEHSIMIVPAQIELCTVLDEWRVAGTFDRLVTVPGFDRPLIADLKTGGNLEYSWQSIAVQLAAYAHGDRIYVQGAATDGSQDTSYPMPDVDQDWGVILWLNADDGTPQLVPYLVDLQLGWQAFEQSMWTRDWRKMKTAYPFGDLADALATSVHVEQQRRGAAVRSYAGRVQDTADVTAAEIDVYQELRDWLQGRIDDIGVIEPARKALVRNWPKDVPSLRKSHDHTYEQLCIIEQLCDDIERTHSLTFPTARPGVQREHDNAIGRVVQMFPGTTITNNEQEPSS